MAIGFGRRERPPGSMHAREFWEAVILIAVKFRFTHIIFIKVLHESFIFSLTRFVYNQPFSVGIIKQNVHRLYRKKHKTHKE